MATVDIQCIPDNIYALSGVVNQKRARFDIKTSTNDEAMTRVPLNLVLVLDRSGSMASNKKLTFAKRAVNSVLRLLNDNDVVHLIAYESNVEIVFENARASTRDILFPLVERITAAGETNMSGAIELAGNLFNKYAHQGHARRMFLFSDGQANVGLQTRAELINLVKQLNKQGIVTDSFGIGADFDDEIMKGIGIAGGSRFFFLESIKVIEMFVSEALMSVFRVCGSQAQLLVRGTNGTIVTKIWGHDNLVQGAQLGDLHVNNLRSILVEFTVSGTSDPNRPDTDALIYELRYHHPQHLQSTPITISKIFSLKFVDDQSLVVGIEPRVRTMHATQMAADMDTQIAQLIKQNELAQAKTLVQEQLLLLKNVEENDDERGTISLLIHIVENMQNKLNNTNVNVELAYQGFNHQSYLKRQNSCEYMENFGNYND
jgi:Mg-chelatase subunit ChlD